MKIGILQTAYKKSAEYGAFYNVQELGLGRALAKKGFDVVLYKAVDGEGIVRTEEYGKFKIVLISTKFFGINGMVDLSLLDPSIDVLLYFCDTQIIVPKVYKWCKNNGIMFIPYVGVIKSHSENIFKRFIMGFFARRNLRIYKKMIVLCKTPGIYKELISRKCKWAELFPVGLDETVMKEPYKARVSKKRSDEDNPIPFRMLFVGRMEEEKQPLEMVRILEELLKVNKNICLTMIGDGYMYEEVEARLKEVSDAYECEEESVNIIRKVPYEDMYLCYKNSDVYINLNEVEILGMSILEAMYYGCPVVALDAPGPRFIMQEGMNQGFIEKDIDGVISRLTQLMEEKVDIDELKLNATTRVKENFVWGNLTDRLMNIING